MEQGSESLTCLAAANLLLYKCWRMPSMGRLSSAIQHLWCGRRGIWIWWERDWVSRIPSEVWGGGKYSPPSPLYTFIFYPPILALFFKNYHGFCFKGTISREYHDFWSFIEWKKRLVPCPALFFIFFPTRQKEQYIYILCTCELYFVPFRFL